MGVPPEGDVASSPGALVPGRAGAEQDGVAAARRPRQRLSGYLLLGLAFMTCPCHLPILLGLLAGTGVASLVNEHVGLAVVVLSVLFVPALVLGLAALNRVDQGGRRRGPPGTELTGDRAPHESQGDGALGAGGLDHPPSSGSLANPERTS